MSSTSTNPSPSSSSVVLRLPDDKHYISVWKVSNGSVVQKGETLAILAIQGSNSAAATAAKPTAATTGHKRPSKRRRPTAAALKAAAAATQSAAPTQPICSSTRDTSSASAASSATAASSSSAATTEKSTFSLASLTSKAVSTNVIASGRKQQQPSQKGDNSNNDGNSQATTTSSSSTTSTTASTASSLSSSSIPLLAPRDGILKIYQGKNDDDKNNNPLDIGVVHDCEHPTRVHGCCVVCGDTLQINAMMMGNNNMNNDTTINNNSNPSSNNNDSMMVQGGWNVSVSEAEQRRMAALDQERLHGQRKLSLVLDLDHTLLHATHDPRAWAWRSQRSDLRSLVLPVPPPPGWPARTWNQVQTHTVKLRPHIKEFLETLQPLYELGVYTAGTRQYAQEITQLLARHLVGCQYDPPELDQLRQACLQLDREIARRQQKQQNQKQQQSTTSAAGENDTKPPAAAESSSSSATTTPKDEPDKTMDNDDSNKGGAKPTTTETANGKATKSPKRKKVSFGEPPPAEDKKPSIEELQSQLAAKQNELQEALRMEQHARDLRQRLFANRIVSRTDVGEEVGREAKSLKRMFPCGGRMAVVVDDREDVWAKQQAGDNRNNGDDDDDEPPKGEPPHNLLLVRPYHWAPFAGFADVNNAAGEDLSKTNNNSDNANNKKTDQATEAALADTETREEQLNWTADILRRIHHSYYNDYEGREHERPTAPQLVKQMRHQVLGGNDKEPQAHLLLSGLVPLHRQQFPGGNGSTAPRPRPQFVRHAENLGATVSTTIHPQLTHVVAAKDGTEKILQVRRDVPDCLIVQAAWLMECAWTLTRRDPKPHILHGSSRAMAALRLPPPQDDRKRKREENLNETTTTTDATVVAANSGPMETTTTTSITKASLKQQLMETLAGEGATVAAAGAAPPPVVAPPENDNNNKDEDNNGGDTDDELAAAFEEELDDEDDDENE